MIAPMFVKPEDAARTASGALANPWTQIAGVALMHAIVVLACEVNKYRALAALTACQQAWFAGEHLSAVQEAVNNKVAEVTARDAFSDARPEQAEFQILDDLDRALKLIADYPKGHRPE
jgi:hypothetical protein